jgi:serine/threonine-protein kinase
MLFEMLTGRLPYPPGTLDQTFRRHNCDPPADIHRYFRSLPSELANLVERLLARRPEDRPRIASVISQLISLEITSLGCRQSA